MTKLLFLALLGFSTFTMQGSLGSVNVPPDKLEEFKGTVYENAGKQFALKRQEMVQALIQVKPLINGFLEDGLAAENEKYQQVLPMLSPAQESKALGRLDRLRTLKIRYADFLAHFFDELIRVGSTELTGEMLARMSQQLYKDFIKNMGELAPENLINYLHEGIILTVLGYINRYTLTPSDAFNVSGETFFYHPALSDAQAIAEILRKEFTSSWDDIFGTSRSLYLVGP